jgi:hypothetical protein
MGTEYCLSHIFTYFNTQFVESYYFTSLSPWSHQCCYYFTSLSPWSHQYCYYFTSLSPWSHQYCYYFTSLSPWSHQYCYYFISLSPWSHQYFYVTARKGTFLARKFTNLIATAIFSQCAVEVSLSVPSLLESAMQITYFEDFCTQKLIRDPPKRQKKI